MTAKQKKLFLLTSMMSVFVMAVAVLFTGGKLSNPLSKVFASQEAVSMESIVFEKANATKSGSTNTVIGYTKYNYGVVCKTTNNDTSYSSGYVGAVQEGTQVHFFESDGATEYLTEDVEKIIMSFTGVNSGNYKSPGFYVRGFYSSGVSFEFSYNRSSSTTGATRTINFHDYGDVSRISVEFKSDANNYCYLIESISLVYNCTPKYQTGVEISTSPAKTIYGEGQSFDPSGMIVKNVYNNGGKIATDHYTITPSGPLTMQDTYVTISSGGFSVTQAITVTDAASHAVGTYKNGSYYIVLYNDGTGLNYYESDSCPLTWSFDGSTLSFYSTKTYSFNGTIFGSSTSVSATNLAFNSDDISSFKVYVKFGSSTSNLTFSRQSA